MKVPKKKDENDEEMKDDRFTTRMNVDPETRVAQSGLHPEDVLNPLNDPFLEQTTSVQCLRYSGMHMDGFDNDPNGLPTGMPISLLMSRHTSEGTL